MNKSKKTITVTPSIEPLPDINPHPEPVFQSIPKASLLFLFIFALALRMIYVTQSTGNPLFGAPFVDAYVYTQWAKKMVDGIWLWDHVGNYLFESLTEI